MIFNLNYGATLASLAPGVDELQATHVHLSIECPKSAPAAADSIFERLRASLIRRYYEISEENHSAVHPLIGVKGATSNTADEIVTDLHLYYFPAVSPAIRSPVGIQTLRVALQARQPAA